MSTKKLKEFESFSDAFTFAIERRDKKYSHYYSKIGMDKGQFSKYIGEGGIKNPQLDTRQKLTDVVGIEIKKENGKWVLHDPIDAQKPKSNYSADQLLAEAKRRMQNGEAPKNAEDLLLQAVLDVLLDLRLSVEKLIRLRQDRSDD